MAKAKVKKKKDKTIRNLLIFVVLFLIILVATVFNDILIIKSNKEETKEYSELYENLLEEEASLNSEVIKLQDPDYIARYAREKFMYTKDGELILKIVDGEILTNDELGEDSKEDKGFGTYAKTISNDLLYDLVQFTKKHISDRTDDILDAKFDINPKVYAGKNIACEFCQFKDICYMKEIDQKYLDKVDDLSFLGGEE